MGDKKTEFIKIRVWLFTEPKHTVVRDGQAIINPKYIEHFTDADAKFREPITTFINDEVGLHNWAIRFKQFDEEIFEVDIYCEPDHYLPIVSIIRERIKEVDFRQFQRKGGIQVYLSNAGL